MRRMDRRVITVVLTGLLVPGLARIGQCQERAAEEGAKARHAISGSLGVSGVVMEGLPGRPTTDQNGKYRVEVEQGWTGTVTPQKPGYTFEPPDRMYESVQSDLEAQDYRYVRIPCTISGSVGVPGVVMKGLPGDPITDAQGRYSATVEYAWSGTVMPVKEGYEFRPMRTTYPRIIGDQRRDFTASMITFVIGGTVYGDGDRAGVAIEGLPGHPLTDSQGRYRVTVPYGWSGTVRPARVGYRFEPAQRQYAPVVADQSDQDYASKAQMVTISDCIVLGDEPIPGVTVTASPGGSSAVTDSRGRYSIRVPYGWSGELTIAKNGFEFMPPSVPYADVTTNIVDGKSVRPGTAPIIPWPRASSAYPQTGMAGAAGNVLIVPTTHVMAEQFAEIAEDMRVMLHILREKLSEPRMILGTLPDYGDFFGGDRGLEAFYLQGHGAMFVMEVDFPFSAPSQQGAGAAAPQEPIDPVWQRARQYLWSPRNSMRYPPPGEARQIDFDRFQQDLVRTLQHAANIRNMEPNEAVILTVIGQDEQTSGAGPSASGGSYSTGGWGGGYSAGGGSFGGGGGGGGSFSAGSFGGGGFYMDSRSRARRDARPGRSAPTAPTPTTTMLTIQAKKADIDAFAHGDIDFEQFRQKVKVFTY